MSRNRTTARRDGRQPNRGFCNGIDRSTERRIRTRSRGCRCAGVGGSTLAYALRQSHREVLVIERGHFLPREPEKSMPQEMHIRLGG